MDGWPLVLSSIHVPFMEPRAAGVDVSDVVIMLFLDLSHFLGDSHSSGERSF